LLRGAKDTWLSSANSERLLAALAGPKKLIVLPDDDHLLLSMRLMPINIPVQAWFQEVLVEDKSPSDSMATRSVLDSGVYAEDR
jgi:hypothetical protein